MLDFLLVLGQIPGTSYQVSFEELMTTCLTVGIIWYAHKKRWTVADAKRPVHLVRVYLSTKRGAQLKLPV